MVTHVAGETRARFKLVRQLLDEATQTKKPQGEAKNYR